VNRHARTRVSPTGVRTNDRVSARASSCRHHNVYSLNAANLAYWHVMMSCQATDAFAPSHLSATRLCWQTAFQFGQCHKLPTTFYDHGPGKGFQHALVRPATDLCLGRAVAQDSSFTRNASDCWTGTTNPDTRFDDCPACWLPSVQMAQVGRPYLPARSGLQLWNSGNQASEFYKSWAGPRRELAVKRNQCRVVQT